MALTKMQKYYIKTVIYQDIGSKSTIFKDDIVNFAKELGIKLQKNCTKESVLDLIFNTENEDKLYEKFANSINVPFYDVAKLNNLTYKQVSDLDQLGIINALTYTGYKDSTIYPLSVLGFKEGELAEIWNNKHKTDFYRTRMEIDNIDDIQNIINKLSNMFEIENLSKLYPHKDNKNACYIYLSIRSLNNNIKNDNYINLENAKLKLENSTLKRELKELNSKITELEANADKFKFLENKIVNLDQNEKSYKNKIEELEKKLKTSSGGRPSKFTDQEKETMKMYRLQGMSIRKIAEMFNCSTGLVHKIITQ